MKRPKTPEELAKKKEKTSHTLYLDTGNVNKLRLIADESRVSVSQIVDEAIDFYLKSLRVKK